MKKIAYILGKTLTALLVMSGAFLCIVFGVLQLDWFKHKLINSLEQQGKREGLDVHIGSLTGMAPLNFTISQIDLHVSQETSLSLEKIKIRISLLDLLRKKLTISYVSIEKGVYSFATPSLQWSDLYRLKIDLPKLNQLPFSIASRHLSIKSLRFVSKGQDTLPSLSLFAKGKIRHDLSELALSCKIAKERDVFVSAQILIDGSQKKDSLTLTADINLPSYKMLYPVIDLPFEGALYARSKWTGRWSSWRGAFFTDKESPHPISMVFSARIQSLNVPSYDFLEGSWSVKGAFHIFAAKKLVCKQMHIEGLSFSSSMKFAVEKGGQLQNGAASYHIKNLQRFSSRSAPPIQGELIGEAFCDGSEAHLTGQGVNVRIGKIDIDPLKIKIDGKKENEIWMTELSLSQRIFDQDVLVHSRCNIEPHQLVVDDLSIHGHGAELSAKGLINWDEEFIESFIHASCEDMKKLRLFFPYDSSLAGGVDCSMHSRWNYNNKDVLSASGDISLQDVRFFDTLISHVKGSFSAIDLWHSPMISAYVDGANIICKDLYLSKFKIQSDGAEKSRPFIIEAKGAWKKDFTLQVSGDWAVENRALHLQVQELKGKVANHPISLQLPYTLFVSSEKTSSTPLSLAIGDGTYEMSTSLSPLTSHLEIKGHHLPLDLLIFSNRGIDARGFLTFEGKLCVEEKRNQGHLNLVLERGSLAQENDHKELLTKGSLQAHLQDGTAQIFLSAYASDAQFIDASCTLPITINPMPLRAHIEKDLPFSANLTMEGALEILFDYFNMGPNKGTGLITSRLLLSNTIKSPLVQGFLTLQNGSYENYITGTRLKQINALLQPESRSIALTSFEAQGKEGGSLHAIGSMQLKPDLFMPYDIEAKLSGLKLLNFDYLSTELSGDLSVAGSMEGSTLSGSVTASKTHVNLSEDVPEQIPQLDITYVNRPIHLTGKSFLTPTSYPLNYDVLISAKDRVFVKGRGLESEWRGDLHLGGKNTHATTEGSLSLIKGSYTFAGKKFSLEQGKITFHSTPTSQAFIQLQGTLALSDVQVNVQIQGPLERPSVTMQSIPYMPTSALLCRILFNKDISEISAPQAIQLANVLVSMSQATGPDVLEKIRRSIGVDRLTIVGKEGSDEISLQIGWYLSHGVLVSLSQSATSSDITLEVNLKHGFIFQAETQNQEEGKFSLKWNKNY